MGWLLRDGAVLCSLEVASTRSARRRGLLGRDSLDGGLLLLPARSVHTFGMGFPIDVAWLDSDMRVVRTACMVRHRMSRPVLTARSVLEAEAGRFASWGLVVGDRLELGD